MPSTYDIGDAVDMTGTFSDSETGDPVTPTTVVCTVQPPGFGAAPQSLATAPVSGQPGKFTAQVVATAAGTWWYSFDGSGGAQASGEQYFIVRARRVPR